MPDPIRETREWVDDFRRALTLTTTPEGGTGWTIKDTSAAGSPTYATAASADGLVLTCTSTSETQVLTLFQNNIFQYDIDSLIEVEWVCKLTGAAANTICVIGLADTQNDTSDTVATSIWFRIDGTGAWKTEYDDGTNTADDIATGIAQSTSFKRFKIDFTGTPGRSGKEDVKMHMSDANGRLVRVADTTQHKMSAYTGYLQPYIQVQKTSTDVPILSIAQFRVRYRNEWV